MPKICDFCQNFKGWEGGQHEQHFVKNKFVKNRVGGRVVNLNLDNVFKYTGFFWSVPLTCFCHILMDKSLNKLGGAVKKNKNSIFTDITQIEVDPPPSHPIFDKFIFDKVLIMLTSLPPLEFLTKITKF